MFYKSIKKNIVKKVCRLLSILAVLSILTTTMSVLSIKAETKAEKTEENYALRLSKSLDYQYFGQQVSLDTNKTYVFSYKYSSGYIGFTNIFKDLKENGIQSVKPEENNEMEYLEKTTIFTPPADAVDGENGKKKVWVGIRTAEPTSNDVYCYDFKLYDAEKPEINLLPDADLKENGDKISNRWINAWGGGANTGYANNGFSKVKVSEIGGSDFFKRADKDRPVIKVTPNTAWMWIGQKVSLDPNKTYSFSYNYSKGDNSSSEIYKNLSEGTFNGIKREEDGVYFKKTTTFTPPADALDGEDGNKLIWVGLRSGGARKADIYYYNFNLFDVENPTVNLFSDYDWLEGGSQINYSKWKSAYDDGISSGFQKISLADIGGADVFKRTENDKNVIKMAAGSSSKWFGQQVSLDPNKEYVFSYYHSPNMTGGPCIYKNLKEQTFDGIKKDFDDEYCKIMVKFTPPADAEDGADGKKLLWVGTRGADASTEDQYYYQFRLVDTQNPDVNLFDDGDWLESGTNINGSKWISAWGDALDYCFSKTTLGEIGGIETFKRAFKINRDPKMMYYDRTGRGPDREPYGCFTMSLPGKVNNTGKNYVFEFSARASKGGVLDQFRMYSLDPELFVDKEFSVKPVKVDGYRYTFNIRQDPNTTDPFTFMIFVPEGSRGHMSYFSMYEADENFNKINDVNLLEDYYDDFSHYQKLGDVVGMYTMQGACIGTETGRLDEMPEYYFDPSPDVEIPAGPKMMSYASKWGPGHIKIALPYTVASGGVNGKNYLVSFYLKPTTGRDPARYYTTGTQGDLVQIYPIVIDGYKYTFFMKETHNFQIVLDIPQGCEGYISNLEVYEADDDFKALNDINVSTSFGQNGNFSDKVMQLGMGWPGITFTNGFTNTFIDTRKYKEQLKAGIPVEYHSSAALSLIPQGYFDTPDDSGWADEYISASSEEAGTIKGELLDKKNAALSGKSITLTSMSDSTVFWNAVTDRSGEFTFEKIPVGGYEISVTAMDNTLITGSEYVWVDDDKDIVMVTLKYDGDSLKTLALTGDFSNINVTIMISVSALLISALIIVTKKRSNKLLIKEN